MTKRELLKRIEGLEKRLAETEDWADHAHRRITELEARPGLPTIPIPAYPSPYDVGRRWGTGDPMPEPPYRVTC